MKIKVKQEKSLEPYWILRTSLVAEMGFEPHDLRVMRTYILLLQI